MDRGAWQAAVHSVTKNRTQLTDLARSTLGELHGIVAEGRLKGFQTSMRSYTVKKRGEPSIHSHRESDSIKTSDMSSSMMV